MIKRGVTLVECLVVAAILLVLVGLLTPAFLAAASNRQATGSASSEPPQTSLLSTVMHDGHRWVIASAAMTVPANFVHHPDCPCRTAEVER